MRLCCFTASSLNIVFSSFFADRASLCVDKDKELSGCLAMMLNMHPTNAALLCCICNLGSPGCAYMVYIQMTAHPTFAFCVAAALMCTVSTHDMIRDCITTVCQMPSTHLMQDMQGTLASLTASFLDRLSSADSPFSLGCAAEAEVVRLYVSKSKSRWESLLLTGNPA